MNKKCLMFLAGIAFAGVMASCHSQKKATENVISETPRMTQQMIGGESNYLPKLHIYRTNGDYINNVPIMLSADGKSVVSFPAPSDISMQSLPLELSDGWLIDRRGVGGNSVFTRYTYEEYMNLSQTPSVAQLIEAVIPGSGVTEIVELPFNQSEAFGNSREKIVLIKNCDALIKDGLQGCKVLYRQK